MSKYEIEYCPWCAGSISQTTVRNGGTAYMAMECNDCEQVFNVQVPSLNQDVEWTNAR